MNTTDMDPAIQSRLADRASLTNIDILARSVISGVLFAGLILALDWIQSRPFDILNTIFLGLIFTVVLVLFDTIHRSGARKKLK